MSRRSRSRRQAARTWLTSPFRAGSLCGALLLCLVEEAPLEHPRPVFGGQLDVARSEQEDLVGDALHAAVERVREAAREVDQPLRQLAVRRLEVEDDRDAVLEPVGDLLRVVEAAREDQVDAGRAGALHGLQVARPAWLGAPTEDARPLRVGLGVGPIVVVVVPRSPGREAAHVRLLVAVGELVLGDIAVLVPVFFLGDPEVDEGTGPDVGETHGAADVSAATGLSRPGHRSRPPRPPPGSPGSFPSRARAARAARRARGGGGSTAETPPGRRRRAAWSSARARRDRPRAAPAAPRGSRPTSSTRRTG